MSNNGMVCGWYETSEGGFDSQLVIKNMLQFFNKNIDTAKSISSYSCIASNGDIDKNTNGIVTAISGRPSWNNRKYANIAVDCGHATSLRIAYQELGLELFDVISGQFTICILDPENERLVLAVDKIGLQHCFYAKSKNGIVFASRADAVVAHPSIKKEINTQSIYNYIYFHTIPSPDSIYTDVRKIINGEYLLFEKNKIITRKYWKPKFNEDNEQSIDALGKEMLSIIESSVSKCCDTPSVGAFLSGGLDSSTVAGMMSKVTKSPVNTFSIGFREKDYDEIAYARIASNHFKTKQYEYYVTPDDVLDEIADIASYFDEPFGNSSALPAYFCAKMAKKEGVERLLAGDGGDELFGGNERYAKQAIFEKYQHIPAFLRELVIEPLFLTNTISQKIPVVKKIYSYIIQAKTPLPDRLETYNFLHRHTANEIFDNNFLMEVDTEEPIMNIRDTYGEIEDASSLNNMLYLDWKKTLHDNDIVKVNRMCEKAGIQVAYPLLDDDLINFSCRVPSNLKINKNGLRWFYKQAISGFLPTEIINKSKHGFGLPFGIWTSEHAGLQDFAYNTLNELKKRQIFADEFIDTTIKMHKSIHAKFYGELVWILMMLELWLRKL